MKRMICALALALSALSLPSLHPATAQTTEQSADGILRLISEDGLTRYVEFSALKNREGITTGGMIFHDPSRVPDDDNDGDPPPHPKDGPSEFYMKAEFDSMTVEKNRAVMNGIVRESSHRSYMGKWVQLVVEDNVENPRLPDQVSWRVCRPESGGWIPSDAERPGDNGAYMRWWATDAERKDDVGIPSPNLIPGESRACQVYTLSSYSFFDMYKWEGNITVRQ